MKKYFWIGLALVLLIVLDVIFVKERQPKDQDTLKIGILSILSGDGAAWGENAQKGFDLAVKEANDRGGVKGKQIELVYEDTKADPKQTVSAYQKLLSYDNVQAFLGPLSQKEVAVIAQLKNSASSVPMIAPSYASLTDRPNPRNPLLIWMDASVEAERMAEYIFSKDSRGVGVISTNDSWEHEVAETFSRKFQTLGGAILSKETLPFDTSEVKSTVTKILSKKPDAIFLGTYFQFIPLITSLKELGYNGKLYGIEVDSYLINETKPLSDGLQFISPDFYTNEFMKKFEKTYGQRPGIPAGQAYDAANILLSFFETYDTKEQILQAMQEFKEYDGVSGRITITDDNRTLLPAAIFEIKNGEIVKISP